jgi:large subunit ribosomal protein L30
VSTLKITQKKSVIGIKPKQRGTMRALGLRRINHTVEHTDNPVVRGMIAKVPHLITVEDGGEATTPAKAAPSTAAEATNTTKAAKPAPAKAAKATKATKAAKTTKAAAKPAAPADEDA